MKLITVHGTGAGDKESHGTRWWQLDSPFQVELSKRLALDPANVEIVPFHWGHGPNSENGRRAAGIALYNQLKEYDRVGQDYHVIGHSHGGSVIYQTLIYSLSKEGKPLERLKSWCTIGTPFLDYRPNRHIFNRLGGTGLTLYASAIGAIVLGFLLNIRFLFNLLADSDPNWIELIAFFIGTLPLVGYGIICLLAVYAYDYYYGDAQPPSLKQKVANHYADRWIGLWHRDDEAISALRNVKEINAPIVASNLFDPVVSLVPVLLLATIAILVSMQQIPPENILLNLNYIFEWPVRTIKLDHIVTSSMETLRKALPADISGLHDVLVMTTLGLIVAACAAAMVAIYVLVARPVVTLLKSIARLIGWPTSKLVNNVVWSAVRGQAWGDDRVNEGVEWINAHPPEFTRQFAPLPNAVGDELSRFSEKHAILTLTKVRELLGMTPDAKQPMNFKTQLSEQLSWRELIHTTYFDVPEFVDLTAVCLNRAGLCALNDDYWTGGNLDAVQDWHHAISENASPTPAAPQRITPKQEAAE